MATRIDILKGKPEKAVMNIAIPIFVYLLISNSYNIVDGMWITGIGKDAIAAIGAVMPLYMIITGVGMGIGTGATSAISYFIGQNNKDRANNVAVHTLIIILIASAVLTVLLIGSLRYYLDIFHIDQHAVRDATTYAIPLFLNSVTFVFIGGLTGVLRGEGETKIPMIASSIGLILDGLLDPLFIYTFDMGIMGASVSTVITSIISLLILFYWIFIRRGTYLDFSFKSFRPDMSIVKRVLNVGIPASVELLIMTVATTCYLWFISLFGANDGTAVFAAGNKLYYLGIMPISATCMALVPVVGNAFGEQSLHKIKKAFRFACILSVSLGFVIMVGIYIFAEPLSFIFAYTTETSSLLPGLVEFVRTTILCLPFLGIGLPSTFLYQGLGRGFQSLCWTFIRELLSSVLFIYLFGYHFSMGLSGVWLGLLTGRTVANLLNYIAAKYTINHLQFPAS